MYIPSMTVVATCGVTALKRFGVTGPKAEELLSQLAASLAPRPTFYCGVCFENCDEHLR
jgi:hypothetical protein